MICRFSKIFVINMLVKQLTSFYELTTEEQDVLNEYYDIVLSKLDYNFSHNDNKYYRKECGENYEAYFDALHSCQWLMFLYTMANKLYHDRETVYLKQNESDIRVLCDKIYGLSKIMSGADIYYEVDLPCVWKCDHPVGSVIGRAQYGVNFEFSQGCTVGNNHDIYPIFGDNVTMFSNSKVLGACNVGNNVLISANTYILDEDIPQNCVVFGQSPNLIIKKRK